MGKGHGQALLNDYWSHIFRLIPSPLYWFVYRIAISNHGAIFLE